MGWSLFRWNFFILSASGWPDRKRKDHEKRGSAETGEASGAASFSVRIKRSCELRHGLKARQVPGLRKGKSNGKKGNKRKNGRQYGVQNNDDGIVLRACETGAGALRKTSGILMVHCRITHRSSSFPQVFLRWCKNTTGAVIFQEKISRLPKDCAMRQNFADRKQKSLSNLQARLPLFHGISSIFFLRASFVGHLRGCCPILGQSSGLCPYRFRRKPRILNLQAQKQRVLQRKDGFYDAHR